MCIRDSYRLVQGDPERPVLPPDALFLNAEQFYARVNQHAQLALRPTRPESPSASEAQDFVEFNTLPDLTVMRLSLIHI